MSAAPAVDFYFGPGSRYSYLASTQLDAITARTGARFRWRPIFGSDAEAAAAGAFGAPSFVTNGQVFFGNDRLTLLEHYLTIAAREA